MPATTLPDGTPGGPPNTPPDPHPNPPPDATESETTGLPALPTWPKVYLLVTLIFVAWVIFLVALARIFS